MSLLTLRKPGEASKERLRQLLEERAGKQRGSLSEAGDNVVADWKEMSSENGVPICNYWWAVAHTHGPNLGHEALFPYTILRERCDDAETHETLSLLAVLVAAAKFAEPKIV